MALVDELVQQDRGGLHQIRRDRPDSRSGDTQVVALGDRSDLAGGVADRAGHLPGDHRVRTISQCLRDLVDAGLRVVGDQRGDGLDHSPGRHHPDLFGGL